MIHDLFLMADFLLEIPSSLGLRNIICFSPSPQQNNSLSVITLSPIMPFFTSHFHNNSRFPLLQYATTWWAFLFFCSVTLLNHISFWTNCTTFHCKRSIEESEDTVDVLLRSFLLSAVHSDDTGCTVTPACYHLVCNRLLRCVYSLTEQEFSDCLNHFWLCHFKWKLA